MPAAPNPVSPWLLVNVVVMPFLCDRCSPARAAAAGAVPQGAVWLTASSPQVTAGSVSRFTCSAPVSWAASFLWFVDDDPVETDRFLPNQPYRVAVHRAEDRSLRAEELAYTVLEISASRPTTGLVGCLVSTNTTATRRGMRLKLHSSYISANSGDPLHYSHNDTCTRKHRCVDDGSSCHTDLSAQVVYT